MTAIDILLAWVCGTALLVIGILALALARAAVEGELDPDVEPVDTQDNESIWSET